ncbi:MAG TPA: YifB family Mg chelatase-like AAA ATPase, partial [Candidatus Bathyarchaeia archaeon]|nr:YifB family Mg chelatase-like AAA ATPase [Candidatus Bathyarchaeia archaeon]
AILLADQQLFVDHTFLQETVFLGELSLDGSVRAIKGALAIAYDARKQGKKRIVVPVANATEAALIHDIEIIGVTSLLHLIGYLRHEMVITPQSPTLIECQLESTHLDFAHVKGNVMAKRALQVAAAGNHNIIFIGPPGSGKTMLARRLASIMPPLNFEHMIETTKIYSVSGKLDAQSLITQRPFRSPHHTISHAGLIGGGSYPQPGEISLAHHGILFLDELTEFRRDILETLRQPLEHKTVSIARVHQSVTFPANCLLVAALNPCPCGFLGDTRRACRCNQLQIQKYLNKLSGPLLDRIDLQIHIQSIDYSTMQKKEYDDRHSSATLYEGVQKARAKQFQRFGTEALLNSMIEPQHIDLYCPQTPEAQILVKTIFDKLRLTMRGYHKLLKVARTIADIADHDIIEAGDIQEAMMYRSMDQYLEQHRL